jgi:hypothetical protein
MKTGATGLARSKMGVYRSVVLLGFWLRVEWLSAETPPESLQVLAQIDRAEKIMAAIPQK